MIPAALSRLLRLRGFRVQTYGSGQEFVAALPAGRPECLIVDLRMPDMNGEALRQHLVDSGIKIPTIFLTADGDATLHGRKGEGDVIGTLRKPVLEKVLFSMIGRVMGGPGEHCFDH
jgi:FixJ family two-component response regulator